MSNITNHLFPGCLCKLRNGLKYVHYATYDGYSHGASYEEIEVQGIFDWYTRSHDEHGSASPEGELGGYDIIAFHNPLHQELWKTGVLDALPEWVTHVAMDEDGEWFGFDREPLKTTEKYWMIHKITGNQSSFLRAPDEPMPTIEQVNELGLTWEDTLTRVRLST